VSYCSPHRNSADVVSAVSPHLTSPTERTQSTAAVNVRPPDLHVDYVSLSRLPCTSPIVLLLLSSSAERIQSTAAVDVRSAELDVDDHITLSPPSSHFSHTPTTLFPHLRGLSPHCLRYPKGLNQRCLGHLTGLRPLCLHRLRGLSPRCLQHLRGLSPLPLSGFAQ